MTEATQIVKQSLHLKRTTVILSLFWTAAIFFVFSWHPWNFYVFTFGYVFVWLAVLGGIIFSTSHIGRRIRERERAEERVACYSRIIEGSLNEFYIFDPETFHFIEVNRGARENLGYSMEELRALTPLDLKPEISAEMFAELVEPLRTGVEEKIHFTTVHRRKDGTLYPVEIHLQLVNDGMPLFIAIIIDITERTRTEVALRESEARFRTIFENAPVLINSFDENSHCLLWNKQCRETFGWTIEEINSHDDPFSLFYHDSAVRDDVIKKVVFEHDGRFREWHPVTKDGRTLITMWANFHLPDGMVISLGYDITDRRQAEEEKAQLEDQYHQAQKVESIGRLAGGVAHDLNNLLTPIIGYSEMLMDDLDFEDENRESVNEILCAGFRARDLVRQLLAFSRKQTLEYRPMNINQALNGFEKLLRCTIREDIAIKFILSPDIRTIMADIGQIEQVIMNLSVNAQDAMPEGGYLTIETSVKALDEDFAAKNQDVRPGLYVMLTVSDTGCGMDEETRSQVFEPFFSTKGEQGTGLGLATVYGIIKQHGGNVWINSSPGKGTTVKVCLPVSGQARGEESISRLEMMN